MTRDLAGFSGLVPPRWHQTVAPERQQSVGGVHLVGGCRHEILSLVSKCQCLICQAHCIPHASAAWMLLFLTVLQGTRGFVCSWLPRVHQEVRAVPSCCRENTHSIWEDTQASKMGLWRTCPFLAIITAPVCGAPCISQVCLLCIHEKHVWRAHAVPGRVNMLWYVQPRTP